MFSTIKSKPRAVIKPGHGSPAVIKKGEKAFDEPSLEAQSVFGEIPAILDGESFVFTNLASGIGFTAEKAGTVFLLTEKRPEKLHWSHPEFGLSFRFPNQYRKIADFEVGTLLPNYNAPLSLYELECTEGMEVRAVCKPGQLSIIIAKISNNYLPVSAAEDDENSLRLTLAPIVPFDKKSAMQKKGYLPSERGYQACPSIAVTANGTIYGGVMADPEGYTFLGGENHYCYVAVMRSRDGIVWEDPVTVFDPDGDGPARSFEPILWTSPDRKRLYLAYTQTAGTSSNMGGKVGTWLTYTDNPEDEVPLWSEPRRVIDGMADSRPFLATDGYWYWSTAFWALWHRRFFDETAPESAPGVHIYRSQNLLDWEHICNVPKTNWGISEPTIIENGKGDLLLIERDSGSTPLRKSSLQNPKEWSMPQPVRRDMKNPESPLMNTTASRNFLAKLPSGRLLFIYHDNFEKVRSRTTAALSEDGGITWPYHLLLDERLHATYPFADVTENGEILIMYDNGRIRPEGGRNGEILLARITEEDIIAGEPVTKNAVLKRMVNRYGFDPDEQTIKEQIKAAERVLKVCDEKEQAALRNAIAITEETPSLENYITLCKLTDEAIKN